MEKCTYCVQRIRQAEIDTQTEQRPLADGEVVTACQAACPTSAIVFGDMNDPQSKVKQGKDSPLHYGLLADLNTNPRTTYLAELRNPNPEIEVVAAWQRTLDSFGRTRSAAQAASIGRTTFRPATI